LSIAIAAALGTVGPVVFSSGAFAQEPGQAAAPPDDLEEVVVTGSRIQRRDYTSNSPIVTVEQDAFEAQVGLNFEAYLNQLPNYNPAAAPTTTQADVQITPVNSVGIASISLRGFGPNRNLVLVDGKRLVPINALMVTDINAIPSALIERVETITGGASAVYGADAVGGVTNFILRDDFEGIDFDVQYGTTDQGGGEERRISSVLGANLAGGRGNVTLGVERYDRDEVLERDREWYRDRYADPHAPGTFTFLQGTTHYNCLTNCPSPGAVEAVFGAPATSVFNPLSFNVFRQFVFNADETLFVENSAAGLANFTGGPHFTFFPSEIFDASVPGNTSVIEGLKWHNLKALVSSPQERYSFFASGNYDFTDRIRLTSRATLAESETRTVLFGTNAIFGWEGTVPYVPATDSPILPTLNYNDPAVVAAAVADPTNPAFRNPAFVPTGTPGAGWPVPVELAALLNSRPAGTYCISGTPGCGAPGSGTYATTNPALAGLATTGDWMPGWSPDYSLPPRSTINTNTVWQLEAGLDIDLAENWTSEIYVSHGQSSAYNNAAGNLSLTRYRELIRRPDYGRNAAISGNATGASPGFGAADVTCTSGFHDTFFRGDEPLSQDCFNAVNATLQTRAQNIQDILEVNFEGQLAELRAGELRLAAGYQRRENSATFVPDILQSTVSFTDQVVGVYPTGYMDASTSVDDLYAEMLVPLIAGERGQRFELELGFRASDYEHTERENTYKTLVNWQINAWVRFRGGYNRATRAPNLGELFLAPQEIFQIGGNNFGDPCGLRSTAPYGAGGTGPDPQFNPATETQPQLASGQTPQGAASARLICEALMGPAAANQFYNVANAAQGGGSPFNWVVQQGNPDLRSETADTWTWGIVMSPPFERPWLSGINLSLDYYRVEIEDAIMLYSVDFANFSCFGSTLVTSPADAAAQAASPECQRVPRNQALGGPLTTSLSYDNQATIDTAGLDLGLNWRLQLSDAGRDLPGSLMFNLQATWLDYYRTKQSPAAFDVETDWKGSLGPNLSGTNPGAYDYRLFGSVGYFANAWGVNLRWRYLPDVRTAAFASQQAIKENNARVAAGGAGVILSYTPTTELETDNYSVFDLSFNWSVGDRLQFRGGVTNLLDTEPEEVGSTAGYPIGTDLAAVCGGAPGCVRPLAFSLPSTGG
ncbi:MAG TPA: TonB-dependent receptor, partial [Gammaproteobacteria bacterium]|nr:TonB-dependent receptor [Gammaproteobacteria bacterium]